MNTLVSSGNSVQFAKQHRAKQVRAAEQPHLAAMFTKQRRMSRREGFAAAFTGAIFALAPFTGPSASASTHVPDGNSHTMAAQFDIAEFVAHAKAQMAHDRATRPTYSATHNEPTTTEQDPGERVAQAKARASHNRGAVG